MEVGKREKSLSVQSGFYLHHTTQTPASNPPMTSILLNLVAILNLQLTLSHNRISYCDHSLLKIRSFILYTLPFLGFLTASLVIFS